MGGSNTVVHDNIIDDQVPSKCSSSRCLIGMGIEAWGNSTKIVNNTVRGYWGWGVAVGTSSNLAIQNNVLCGPDMIFISNEGADAHSGEKTSKNNTSTALYCSQ